MFNLVPQAADVNRKGRWRRTEIDILNRAQDEDRPFQCIDWESMILYNGGNRPRRYLLCYHVYNEDGSFDYGKVKIISI